MRSQVWETQNAVIVSVQCVESSEGPQQFIVEVKHRLMQTKVQNGCKTKQVIVFKEWIQ